MSAMASQITSLTSVYSSVYSGTDQRKHQSSASLAIVQGIHRSPVNSPHKGPVTRKMFPFGDGSSHILVTRQGAKHIACTMLTCYWLTHWGLVMNCVNIGSGNALSPGWHQAITWTTVDYLTIEPSWTNLSETWIKIGKIYIKNMQLKMLSAKWQPFCSGLNELKIVK